MGGCRCNINSMRSSSAASVVAFIVSSDRNNLYRAWSLMKAGTVLFGVTGEDIFLEAGRQFFREGECCLIPVHLRFAQCSPSTSSLMMMDSLVTAMYIYKSNKYSCHDFLAIVFIVALSKHLIGLLPCGYRCELIAV